MPGDLAALHAIQSREDVTRWLYWGPRSEDEVRGGSRAHRAAPGEGVVLAVELRGGGAGRHVSLVVDAETARARSGSSSTPTTRGAATRPRRRARCSRFAFEHYDLHRVYGRLEPRNEGSARVLERLGMRREALLVENEWVKGEWQSEAIYALLAREWAER